MGLFVYLSVPSLLLPVCLLILSVWMVNTKPEAMEAETSRAKKSSQKDFGKLAEARPPKKRGRRRA